MWTVNWDFTTENYGQVLQGKDFEYVNPDGSVEVIPATTSGGDPQLDCGSGSCHRDPDPDRGFAAYGFAWMDFTGRRFFFIIVVALLVVPLQIALSDPT